MKQKIQKFPKFLADRFQPCILCSFSDEVLNRIPDIMDRIVTAWNQINLENKTKIRIIFPKCKVNINVATNELTDMRFVQPRTKPYFFLNKEPVILYQSELPTMRILRQRLFETDFMPYHLYCDIPISILLFTVNKENAFPSKSYFPDWILPIISSIQPDIVKIPVQNFQNLLRNFFNKRYIQKLMKSEQDLIHNFQSVKKDNWFLIRNEPSSKMLSIKYYADLKMQQGNYNEAINEYKRLFETPLDQQCRFLIFLCNIMKGERKSIDVNSIDLFLPDDNLIEKFAIHMAKLYVRRSISVMKELLPYGRLFIVIKPFLYEQYAYLHTLRKRSYMLYYAGCGFSSINSPEHEIMCLYNAWGIIHAHNFDLVSQNLLEKALDKYKGEHSPRLVELLLSCRNVFNPHSIQTLLFHIFEEKKKLFVKEKICDKEKNGDNDNDDETNDGDEKKQALIYVPPNSLPPRNLGESPIYCGFVDSRIVKIESNGYPCAPPNVFTEYWPKTAQQLFGAFDHRRFFSTNIFAFLECSTDEVNTLQVFFNNRCPEFQLTNARLRVSGTADVETFPELPGAESGNVLSCKFIARTKGTLEISGIEFEYLIGPSRRNREGKFLPYDERGIVKFVKIFPGKALSFTVYDTYPKIDIAVEGGKSEILVNEIVPISIRITNGPVKLKYLAMMIVGNAAYNVIVPTSEELSGQRFIKALEPFEQTVVKIAVCGKRIGVNKLTVIFPFWAFEPPCRYVYKDFVFNVSPAPEIPLFMQNVEVVGQCPNGYRAFGFTAKSFDARMFVTKLQGRNCHMSLVTALGTPSMITVSSKNGVVDVIHNAPASTHNKSDNQKDSKNSNNNKDENENTNKNENENTNTNKNKNKSESEKGGKGDHEDTDSICTKCVKNADFYYELPEFCQSFIEDEEGILFWYKTDLSYVFARLEISGAYVTAIIENVESSHDSYDLFKLTLKNISKRRLKDVRVSFVEMQEEISYVFSGVSVKNVGILEEGGLFEYYFRMRLLFDKASPVVMISGENFALVHPVVIKRNNMCM